MSTSRSTDPREREDLSGPPKTKLIRIPPYHYLHVLDRNTNVTRLVVGPQTFVCKEHERLVFGPEKMVIVPPRHYCIIANPAVRSKPEALQKDEEQKLQSKKEKKLEKKVEPQASQIEEHQDRIRTIIEKEQATRGDVVYDAQGQAVLLHGEKEIRFSFDEPFPLYPGEILEGQIRPLQIVQANTALLLRANIDFQDKFGLNGTVERKAGEQWLWYGPSTYYPQIEVGIISTVNSVIIKPNQALRLKAERECLDYNNVKRKPGEQWLVRREGAYLPNACESVVSLVDAIVLTEKVALHLRAVQTFTDELNNERKVGEEWLVSHKQKETHIPDVYEEVVARVELTSLSNREYCCIRDPVDENNIPQLGQRKLIVGEANFFLQPGETLESRNPVYVLGEEEALAVNCLKSFTEEYTYKGKQYKTPRIAGQRYDVYGPREYVPPLQVQVLQKKKALVQLESLGLYTLYM